MSGSELLTLTGVGGSKLEKYGAGLLRSFVAMRRRGRPINSVLSR